MESLNAGNYQHVIVRSAGEPDAQEADARTLVTLLQLRDLEQRLGDPYSIVSEINDDANREIVQVTKADDLVVSEKLISLVLTQLTESRHLAAVSRELFSPKGVEIYAAPAGRNLVPGMEAKRWLKRRSGGVRRRLGAGCTSGFTKVRRTALWSSRRRAHPSRWARRSG